jgi:PleD family two-component response regulator
MSPNHDILVVNDRMLDAHETLVALEQVAPRATVLLLDSSNEALEYLFSVGAYAGRPPIMPRLVLLSAEMSDVSGLCLLDLMRAHTLTCTVPIILLSLESDMRKFRRHDQFDADAYVMKPLDFKRYCSLLEGCVRCWVPSGLRPSDGRDRAPAAASEPAALPRIYDRDALEGSCHCSSHC